MKKKLDTEEVKRPIPKLKKPSKKELLKMLEESELEQREIEE